MIVLTRIDVRLCQVFRLSEWNRMLEIGAVLESTGRCFWGTRVAVSLIPAFGQKPKWATNVVWYNE